MDDLLREFLTETSEGLSVLDVELVQLEQTPNDPGLLGNIFRIVHTIKGTCGFLGLPRLEAVAHASENVLGKYRDGELEVTADSITLILESLDTIKAILGTLEETGSEPEGDDSGLIDRLNAAAEGNAAGGAAETAEVETPEEAPAEAGAAEDDAAVEDVEAEVVADAAPETEAEPSAESQIALVQETFTKVETLGEAAAEMFYQRLFEVDPKLKALFKEDIKVQGRKLLAMLKTAVAGLKDLEKLIPAVEDLGRRHVEYGVEDAHYDTVGEALLWTLEQGLGDDFTPEVKDAWTMVYGILADKMKEAAAAAPKPKAVEAPQKDKPAKAAAESSIAAQSIRVQVDQLENLMTMVSELVLTRNQLLQIMRGRDDAELAVPLQHLNHVTSELQEGVMKTRMQPIGNAWAKLPRIVRDISQEFGKKIQLQMRGEETELDRQVLELIRDPLTHMVRNSCDHGIESGQDRLAAGKPEAGRIVLEANHEGGHIIIRIADDGKGLALDKIKAKALESGIVTEAELGAMSDQQIQQLIFRAGFSTAAVVTNVSGRGVGMDVVKTNIEKIGGNIELNSVEGEGSTFTIKIPLTLAIVNALIVECAGERFAIPQINVTELVRSSQTSEHRLEQINGVPVLRLRDSLLPLVNLRRLMRLDGDNEEEETESNGQDSFIVVSQVGTYSFGIIVDRVFDTEEIVVKPVAPILRDLTLFSGNTVLGDGSVIMILDPNGIAAATGDVAGAEAEAGNSVEATDAGQGERVALLLFRAGEEAPKAVPLSLVARLEEFDSAKIEHSDSRPVVQYREQLMPLVTISGNAKIKEEGRQPVIVFSERDRSMGLLVDEIVDIVEESLNVELSANEGSGLLGSAVIAGNSTDIIDVAQYLSRAFDDWFGVESSTGFEAESETRRILLVDDSPFFRNLLTPLLSVAGYTVTTADSGGAAMRLCEAGEKFDVIVSDIEMPEMNGFEFASCVRSSSEWGQTPVVALSSHATPKDLERGREAGFVDYVAKFDRDALLQSLSQTIAAQKGAA